MHNINMDYLSMGMSNDFEIAIEEGANMIELVQAFLIDFYRRFYYQQRQGMHYGK